MYWQREYLRDSATWTRNSTYRVDLPSTGKLGALLLRVSAACTSGATLGGGSWRIMDFISAFEVIANGSTPIKDFPGSIAHALSFFDHGEVSPSFWRNYATNTQYEYFLITFGRHLFDTKYFLPLNQFDNVELQFTNTATSTYYGGDFSLDVIMFLLRGADAPASAGYFRTEVWREWTTVADEWKYLELPTEQKVRRIILQAIPDLDSDNVSETSANNLMYDIKFALQTGLLTVFDGDLDDLMLENVWEFGKLPITHAYIDGTADKGFDRGVGRALGAAGISGSKDGAVSSTIPTAEGDNQNNTIRFEAREADSPIHLFSMGLGYMNCAIFNFDHAPDSPAGLDPELEKTVKLDIHTRNSSSAADGTNRVVLDRLVV